MRITLLEIRSAAIRCNRSSATSGWMNVPARDPIG